MEIIIKNRYKGMLLFCLLVLTMAALLPTHTLAASPANPLTLQIDQVFTVQDGAAPSDQFTYKLTANTPDAPMPANSVGNGYTFSIQDTNSASVGPILFTQAGTYSYKIAQTVDDLAEGYTYDREVYSLTVYIDAGLHADLVIQKSDGSKTQIIRFKNGFSLRPSDPSVMVDPPVKKTVMGNPMTKGTFIFQLEAKDKTSPMPVGSSDGIKRMTIVGPGEEDFGTWSYTQSGTYYYTVSEVYTGEAGYTYDTEVYTIIDSVKNEDGQLVVTRTITNANNKPVSNFTFINHYETPGDGGGNTNGGNTGGGSTNGPKTGDDTNATALLITMGITAFTAVACLFYLLLQRHKKQEDIRQYWIKND